MFQNAVAAQDVTNPVILRFILRRMFLSSVTVRKKGKVFPLQA
jgi:hypothetical protein